MLSYRHSFHAGNFADLLKHSIYIHCLEYMTQKPKSLRIIDTHSGAGCYSLDSADAQKNAEFSNGIGKIWQATDLPELLQRYRQTIASFNSSDDCLIYPGSPLIAESFLRPSDQLFVHELHPTDYRQLHELLGQQKNIRVLADEGMQSLVSLVPPPEKRGLVLIDPSYEMKQDYHSVVEQLIKAHKRFSTGSYLLWYPVVSRQRIDDMELRFKKSGIRNIQVYELAISADTEESGMTSSGIIAINPPWTLWKLLQTALPYAVRKLGNADAFYRLEQLVAE